jgi:hypothetical protein|tara:strand:- start:7110 stop:7373 length:264 start_codon:yes stop_codon:yes gene_type:complete
MQRNIALVGDIVRSYDFQPMPDRGESYIEGIVISKTDYSYTIAVQKRLFAGEVEMVAVGETVETPFKIFFGDWEGRIANLSPHGVAA